MNSTGQNNGKLQDFDFIGEEHFSMEEMLKEAYLEGQKDLKRDIKNKLNKGLQTSAVTSSLFKEKLEDSGMKVKNMFLRISDLVEFECLAIISDENYFDQSKRWNAYAIARDLNQNLDDLEIKFSLLPFSEKIEQEKITSEGFYFKYAK